MFFEFRRREPALTPVLRLAASALQPFAEIKVPSTTLLTAPGGIECPVTPSDGALLRRAAATAAPSLTTIFTPPALCFQDVYVINGLSDWQMLPTIVSSCYPSGTVTSFSPGICPTGYTVDRGVVTTPFSNCSYASIPITQYFCCPSHFHYDTALTGSTDCAITLNQPTVVTTGIFPVTSYPTSTITTQIIWLGDSTVQLDSTPTSYKTWATANKTVAYNYVIRAPVFQVAFAATDSAVASTWASLTSSLSLERASSAAAAGSISTTDSSLSLQTVGISNGGSTTSSASSSSSTSSSGGTSGISSGAIAGIVIGALAGLALFIAGVFLFLRRRRNQRKRATSNPHDAKDDAWTKQELAGNPVERPELDGERYKPELPGNDRPPAELLGDTRHNPYELDHSSETGRA